MSPELKNHLLYPEEYIFYKSMFKSSDIFSFGLILLRIIILLKEE